MSIAAAEVSPKPARLRSGRGIATNPVTPATGVKDIVEAAVLADDTTISATIADVIRDPMVLAAVADVNSVANSGASAVVAAVIVAVQRAHAVVVTWGALAGRSLAVVVMMAELDVVVASVAVDESTELVVADVDVSEKVVGSAVAMGLTSANPLALSTERPGCKAPSRGYRPSWSRLSKTNLKIISIM